MKDRNVSVDLFRFVASLGIMFSHVGWQLNDTLMKVSPLIEIFITRTLVLLFFLISGYYFLDARMKGKNIFAKQIGSLVKVYVFWTIVYYLMSFVINVLIQKESITTFLIQRVQFFFGEGSYPHLWYMTALIYALVMAEIAFRIAKEKGLKVLTVVSGVLYIVGIAHSEYGIDAEGIPVLNNLYEWSGYEIFRNIFCIGLPSVMLGYILVKIKEKWSESPRLIVIGFLTCVILLALEGLCVNVYVQNPDYKAMLLMPLMNLFFMLLLFKYPMLHWEKHDKWLKRMSSYIYFSHPAFIAVASVALEILGITLPHFLLFIIIGVIVMTVGMLLMKINKKSIHIII